MSKSLNWLMKHAPNRDCSAKIQTFWTGVITNEEDKWGAGAKSVTNVRGMFNWTSQFLKSWIF